MVATVYCSGSIPKATSQPGKTYWSADDRAALERGAYPHKIAFLTTNDPLPDLTCSAAVFGRDMFQLELADYVVVDARQSRGIGVGIEIMVSRLFRKPLVVVAPRNTHYRPEHQQYRGAHVAEYIHPHLDMLADVVVETFEEAGEWVAEDLRVPKSRKGVDVVEKAIEEYRTRLLPEDKPMVSILMEMGVTS